MPEAINLALRFGLELCALGALGYWGFKTGDGLLSKVALGVGAPLLAALVWGAFVAPQLAVAVSAVIRLVFEVAVFGSAAVALVAAGHPRLALAFAVVVVINSALVRLWAQ